MVTKILSLLLCVLSINVWGDKVPDPQDEFRAPKTIRTNDRWPLRKFPGYKWRQSDSSVSFIKYFDSSVTIMSSSGDTEDITIAKKGDRIFFYDHYRLVGSDEGYTEREALNALTQLQPENRYWRDVAKYSAITVGSSATLFTVIQSAGAPLVNLLNQAAFYGQSTINTPTEIFTSVAAITAAVAIPIILVYNKYSGKPQVYRNVMTSYDRLLAEGKTHIGIFRSESHFYSELLHLAAKSIQHARCARYF